MIKVAILTISDSCSQGKRQDVSGETIRQMLSAEKFDVCQYLVVPDIQQEVAKQLMCFSDEVKVDIVLTTGGTGLGPRDVTPEATLQVCDKMIPGLVEAIRAEGLKKTKNAILSRSVAGIRVDTLIINLPGSPKAVTESLEVILDILPHAIEMLRGRGHN